MLDSIKMLQFLNVIFGSETRAAHSVELTTPNGTKWYIIFNADEDHVCTIHVDQARYLYYGLRGEPAEFWKSMSILDYGRIPYEPTDSEYDDLAKLYGMI